MAKASSGRSKSPKKRAAASESTKDSARGKVAVVDEAPSEGFGEDIVIGGPSGGDEKGESIAAAADAETHAK